MLAEKTTLKSGGNASLITRLPQILLRYLWLIVLVAVTLTGSALGFSLVQTPTYEASIKILIGQKTAAETTPNLGGDVAGLQDLTVTMARAVTTDRIAQATAEQLDLPAGSAEGLLENLSAQESPGTMFVDVSYKDPDPERAQLIANTVGKVFSEEISEVNMGASTVTATVWEPAVLPETPASPIPLRNGIVALVLGIWLGLGLAFVLEYLNDRRKQPEEMDGISRARTRGNATGVGETLGRRGKQ